MSEKKSSLKHRFKQESWRILTIAALILLLTSTLNQFLVAIPVPRFSNLLNLKHVPSFRPVDYFWSFKMVEYEVNLVNGTPALVARREVFFWTYLSNDWSGYTGRSLYGYDGSPVLIGAVLTCVFVAEISAVVFGILAALKRKRCLLPASAVSACLAIIFTWFFPYILNGTYTEAGFGSWFWLQHYAVGMLIAAALIQYRTPGTPLSKKALVFLASLLLLTLVPTYVFFLAIGSSAEFAMRTEGNFQIVVTEDYYGDITVGFRASNGAISGVTDRFFTIALASTVVFFAALFFLLKEMEARIKASDDHT